MTRRSSAPASASAAAATPTAGAWAVRIAEPSAMAWGLAAALRRHHGIEAAAADGDGLWLRGDGGGAELAAELRRLGLRAHVRRDGMAWRDDAPLPLAALPADGWRSLRAATMPILARAALPALAPAPLTLRVVPSDAAGAQPPAAAVLLPLAAFAAWAADAPEHRLRALRFAAAGDGSAVVVGDPLPPLPGRRLWRHGAALLPCGATCDPPCPAAAIAAVFALAGDDLAVVLESAWHLVPGAALVPAARAAVRMAAETATTPAGTP